MTVTVVVMILLGIVFVIASYIISENLTGKESNHNIDLMTVEEDYQFSDRELQIIKRKIEDVIAKQAKDILYETNESLNNMANEKTMALGDYAVAVCDEIEKNHKEVMFLYSMLDDKQKEIMKTVKDVDDVKKEVKEIINESREEKEQLVNAANTARNISNDTERIQVSPAPVQNISVAEKKEPADSYNNVQTKDYVQDNTDKTIEPEISDFDDIDADLDDIFAELDKTDIDFDEVLEKDFRDDGNANDIILEMYQNGHSVIEIAKELGLGVGEVKLVIDLYQGE